MHIRPVEPSDFDELGALTVDAYRPFGVVDDEYGPVLADVAGRAAVAPVLVAVDDDGTLLGGVTYVPPGENPMHENDEGDVASIRMLAIADHARRRGIGRALSERMIDMARADGAEAVVLHSSVHMTAAHAMYELLGFVRDPNTDWEPEPGIELIGYRLDLSRA